MGYIMECERVAAHLPVSDGDRAKFYKRRAPLGDCEFYRLTQTLPWALENRLIDLQAKLSGKITAAGKAELKTWKDDLRQWRYDTDSARRGIGLYNLGPIDQTKPVGSQFSDHPGQTIDHQHVHDVDETEAA